MLSRLLEDECGAEGQLDFLLCRLIEVFRETDLEV